MCCRCLRPLSPHLPRPQTVSRLVMQDIHSPPPHFLPHLHMRCLPLPWLSSPPRLDLAVLRPGDCLSGPTQVDFIAESDYSYKSAGQCWNPARAVSVHPSQLLVLPLGLGDKCVP